jgi:hypothetical protein
MQCIHWPEKPIGDETFNSANHARRLLRVFDQHSLQRGRRPSTGISRRRLTFAIRASGTKLSPAWKRVPIQEKTASGVLCV